MPYPQMPQWETQKSIGAIQQKYRLVSGNG